MVSPMTLNLLRWGIAFLLLLPLAGAVLRPGSGLWPQWRRFAWLSLFSIGGYNALLYLALNTSTAINVTLVGASTPVWMLLIGRLFFKVAVTRRQLLGAALSMAGVLLVLGRGDWEVITQLRLVPGDLYVLLASVAWAFYSWLLAHPTPESATIRADWAQFLLGQMVFVMQHPRARAQRTVDEAGARTGHIGQAVQAQWIAGRHHEPLGALRKANDLVQPGLQQRLVGARR